MSSSIHRFTPPTCTLEITNKKLPFRWIASDVLPKLQFKLRFDDPRQTTFKQVTIQGNRQDLLQLQTAINHYVRIQLQSSFQAKAKDIPLIPQGATIREETPYLTPQGLMHHELFLGKLTHDNDRQSIKLGTVQLFDLVTALAAYQTEIIESGDKHRALPKVIVGGGITAVAIAAIAIVTVLRHHQPKIATNTQPQSFIKIPELNKIIPPSTPDTSQQTATPKLIDPLASTQRLPPPPAVETPKPKPNIPDPADYPLSDVARQSGFNNLMKNNTNNRGTKSASISPQAAKPETTAIKKIPPATTSSSSQTKIISPNPTKTGVDLKSKMNTLDESLVKPAQDLPVQGSSNQPSQVQQVTAYFKNKWQPPADLSQSLEYRLFINPNGSITKIVPLGKAAQIYLSQTNIPIHGEAFVSPLSKSQPSIIRLLLNPDGKVQVFIESK